jgi:hypothetical protein
MSNQIARRQKRLKVRVAWSLPILLYALTFGCALHVRLVGDYDELTDQTVTDLQSQTATFFATMKTAESPDNSYEANVGFYDEVRGKISGLIVRSEIIEDGLARTPLTENFRALQEQYDELGQHHKEEGLSRRYIESAEKAFEQSFRAILKHLLYLKWNKTEPED